jgi:DNA-directed RNA polymerase sigma subunit (sigma70/sigma32)
VRAAVNELPGHLRKAIKARMAGATLQAVASQVDRSRECVRQWELHAHQLLRESLERRGAA